MGVSGTEEKEVEEEAGMEAEAEEGAQEAVRGEGGQGVGGVRGGRGGCSRAKWAAVSTPVSSQGVAWGP